MIALLEWLLSVVQDIVACSINDIKIHINSPKGDNVTARWLEAFLVSRVATFT
jgi:hypothetical protein